MARKVTLRPEAESDLNVVFEHIAQDNPIAAERFVGRIRAYCEGFAEFGERGTVRPDLGKGLRIVGFERRVAIVFRIKDDRVQIVRIFYGGRDLERLLRDEDLK